MRVIIAGATGTLGLPLLAQLNHAGHDVVGIAHTPAGVATLTARGAQALVADVLDRDALLLAVEGMRADAVIHELTALKKAPATFGAMNQTNRLRIEGSANLVEAAQAVGATRFLTQSIVFGYGFGDIGDVTEESEFGQPVGDARDAVIEGIASAERQAFAAEGMSGIALRYGLFYGRDIQTMTRMLDRWSLPVATTWRGTLALVHHDDAAAATVGALERGAAGRAYNIVDDTPVSWRDYVETVSAVTGARAPLALPDGLLRAVVPYAGLLMTRINMRVSNERAKRELGWSPRYPAVSDGVRASG